MIKFLKPTFHISSIRVSRVAQQITYQYSVLVHTLLRKTNVTEDTASLILLNNSAEVVANDGPYILDVNPKEVKGSSYSSHMNNHFKEYD